MINRKAIAVILSVALALSLLTIVGLVFAQSETPDTPDSPAKAPNAVAAIVNDVVQVQGRLTDANENPIDGNSPCARSCTPGDRQRLGNVFSQLSAGLVRAPVRWGRGKI